MLKKLTERLYNALLFQSFVEALTTLYASPVYNVWFTDISGYNYIPDTSIVTHVTVI
jgi:hypothetical protein